MEHRYLEGVAVPRFDHTLTEALLEDAARDEGGAPKRLGIENGARKVYRVFTVYGQAELEAAMEELALMDFTAVLLASHNSSPADEWDLRFRPDPSIEHRQRPEP
ncbi:hypothetical protein [Vreelandella venusta]|uniref:hypothetical protein n=1 Tax=Vreelandella venusta TaxID=44935 RepID=UPI0020104B18|nr:hypothetical protein [Halomonas venusta]UQI40947.1 hypothetical protein M3L73_01425 [Halomonas venusta]